MKSFLIITGFGLALITGCAQRKNESISFTPDSLEVEVARDPEVVEEKALLFHSAHKEDKSYPWYDTQYAGEWVKEDHIKALLEILESDTTLSLYEYCQKLDPCAVDLIHIEIEGCVVDKLFYLKNLACHEKYISKSSFEVGKQSNFKLLDAYSGMNYTFESPGYDELIINGNRYVKYNRADIEHALNGRYIVYDLEKPLDTIDYIFDKFSDSNLFFQMSLFHLAYFHKSLSDRPILQHSDLVTVYLFNGDTTTTEIVGDSGEGSGNFETGPDTDRIRFDLKRTSDGFELHNSFDDLENKVIKPGLVYRFVKIGEPKRIR